MTLFTTDTIPSPLGPIRVVSNNEAVCSLDFAEYEARMHMLLRKRYYGQVELQPQPLVSIREVLTAYFDGELHALSAIPTDTAGTQFQQHVWRLLRQIPVGETCSYRAIAEKLGQPNAVRAVGMANSRNPVALIIPCHRVIAADGSLSGYAGGVERKRWLLAHEAAARNKILA